MATVTGAKISYSRTIQPREYESKKAEVDFMITFEEGENDLAQDITEDMLQMAKDVVHKILGLKPKADK